MGRKGLHIELWNLIIWILLPSGKNEYSENLIIIGCIFLLEPTIISLKIAFLHGDLDEQIYMEVPLSFESKKGMLCWMKKALYWLSQSPPSCMVWKIYKGYDQARLSTKSKLPHFVHTTLKTRKVTTLLFMRMSS